MEMIPVENEEVSQMKEQLARGARAFLTLLKVHENTVDEMREMNNTLRQEKDQLMKQNEKILRELSALCVEQDRNKNRITKLEEDLEVATTRIDLQQDLYNSEVTLLKEQHRDAMKRNRTELGNVKKKLAELEGDRVKKRNGPPSLFTWPKLSVEKVRIPQFSSDEEENEEKIEFQRASIRKKRKLYHEDDEAVFDLG